MCGLSGFAYLRNDIKPSVASYNLFLSLFVTSQLRGFDASGLSGFWKQESKSNKDDRQGWMTVKKLISPYPVFTSLANTIDTAHFSEKMRDKYERPVLYAAIGHTRQATTGDRSEASAHPFSFGNNRFIGVHNGTITNAEEVYEGLKDEEPLDKTTAPTKDYTNKTLNITDSETILYCIYRWGIDKVYPLIQGAWAFVWWDEQSNSIHFIRNYQRSLYFAFSYLQDALFWSSEEEMLEFAFKRSRLQYDIKDQDKKEFKAHILYSLNMRKPKVITRNQTEFPWDEMRDLNSLRSVIIYHSNYNEWNGNDKYHGGSFFSNLNNNLSKVVNHIGHSESIKASNKIDNKDIIHLKYSPIQRRPIPEDEWEQEQAHYGYAEDYGDFDVSVISHDGDYCCWCGSEITKEKTLDALRLKGIGLVCDNCASEINTVTEIIEAYPQAGEDYNWIKRWNDLDDALSKGENVC